MFRRTLRKSLRSPFEKSNQACPFETSLRKVPSVAARTLRAATARATAPQEWRGSTHESLKYTVSVSLHDISISLRTIRVRVHG